MAAADAIRLLEVVRHGPQRNDQYGRGLTPALTIAAGAAHAFAASFTGRRLFDGGRTRSFAEAGLVGAFTSLLALAIYSADLRYPPVPTDLIQPSGWIGYFLIPVFGAAFAFLANRQRRRYRPPYSDT